MTGDNTSRLAAHAAGLIQAPLDAVAAQLRDATTLDQWNPAIRVLGAKGDQAYAIKAHGLGGTLTYMQSSSDMIEMRLAVPGLREEGQWVLEPTLFGTRVEHSIRWDGPLARLIGDAEVRRIPALRLARLRDWVLASEGIAA